MEKWKILNAWNMEKQVFHIPSLNFPLYTHFYYYEKQTSLFDFDIEKHLFLKSEIILKILLLIKRSKRAETLLFT